MAVGVPLGLREPDTDDVVVRVADGLRDAAPLVEADTVGVDDALDAPLAVSAAE